MAVCVFPACAVFLTFAPFVFVFVDNIWTIKSFVVREMGVDATEFDKGVRGVTTPFKLALCCCASPHVFRAYCRWKSQKHSTTWRKTLWVPHPITATLLRKLQIHFVRLKCIASNVTVERVGGKLNHEYRLFNITRSYAVSGHRARLQSRACSNTNTFMRCHAVEKRKA